MKLPEALEIAERVKAELEPFCARICIAGSIRREKPNPKDIEIVCIPHKKVYQVTLFGTPEKRPLPGFIDHVNRWEKVKGEPTGKYTQRILPEGIKLDLFMCELDNWGYIFAIRTGSAIYSYKVLGSRWRQKGLQGKDGYLYNMHGEKLILQKDLFDLLDITYIHPKHREVYS